MLFSPCIAGAMRSNFSSFCFVSKERKKCYSCSLSSLSSSSFLVIIKSNDYKQRRIDDDKEHVSTTHFRGDRPEPRKLGRVMLVLSSLTALLNHLVTPPVLHTAILLTPQGHLVAYSSRAQPPLSRKSIIHEEGTGAS